MNISESYTALAEGKVKPPSWLMAILPEGAAEPDVSMILDILEKAPLTLVEANRTALSESSNAKWEIEAKVILEEDDQETTFLIWSQASEDLGDFHQQWEFISEEDFEMAQSGSWSIGLSLTFREDNLTDYFRQLKMLAIVAPHARIMLDVAACRPFSWTWVLDNAAASVPPAPENLYCIHAVYDESGDVWMHTHGLLRCGVIELEIREATRDNAGSLSALINTTAKMLIENGIPEPAQAFTIGRGIEMVWLPWESSMKYFSGKSQGSSEDRDENHNHPSGILFSPGGILKKYHHPSRYMKILEDNPLLYISTMETERMAQLARERFPQLKDIFTQASGEEWSFLVKLGYTVDNAETPDEREHLWFQIHEFTGDDQIDATLINEPYAIERMKNGDRGKHSPQIITEWIIYSPFGSFNADSVQLLLRYLEENRG